MKKLFLLLLVVTSVMAMSCTSHVEQNQIAVDNYFKRVGIFELVITYKMSSNYNDSISVRSERILFLAKDVYDAQRMAESTIRDYRIKGGVLNTEWITRYIQKRERFRRN